MSLDDLSSQPAEQQSEVEAKKREMFKLLDETYSQLRSSLKGFVIYDKDGKLDEQKTKEKISKYLKKTIKGRLRSVDTSIAETIINDTVEEYTERIYLEIKKEGVYNQETITASKKEDKDELKLRINSLQEMQKFLDHVKFLIGSRTQKIQGLKTEIQRLEEEDYQSTKKPKKESEYEILARELSPKKTPKKPEERKVELEDEKRILEKEDGLVATSEKRKKEIKIRIKEIDAEIKFIENKMAKIAVLQEQIIGLETIDQGFVSQLFKDYPQEKVAEFFNLKTIEGIALTALSESVDKKSLFVIGEIDRYQEQLDAIEHVHGNLQDLHKKVDDFRQTTDALVYDASRKVVLEKRRQEIEEKLGVLQQKQSTLQQDITALEKELKETEVALKDNPDKKTELEARRVDLEAILKTKKQEQEENAKEISAYIDLLLKEVLTAEKWKETQNKGLTDEAKMAILKESDFLKEYLPLIAEKKAHILSPENNKSRIYQILNATDPKSYAEAILMQREMYNTIIWARQEISRRENGSEAYNNAVEKYTEAMAARDLLSDKVAKMSPDTRKDVKPLILQAREERSKAISFERTKEGKLAFFDRVDSEIQGEIEKRAIEIVAKGGDSLYMMDQVAQFIRTGGIYAPLEVIKFISDARKRDQKKELVDKFKDFAEEGVTDKEMKQLQERGFIKDAAVLLLCEQARTIHSANLGLKGTQYEKFLGEHYGNPQGVKAFAMDRTKKDYDRASNFTSKLGSSGPLRFLSFLYGGATVLLNALASYRSGNWDNEYLALGVGIMYASTKADNWYNDHFDPEGVRFREVADLSFNAKGKRIIRCFRSEPEFNLAMMIDWKRAGSGNKDYFEAKKPKDGDKRNKFQLWQDEKLKDMPLAQGVKKEDFEAYIKSSLDNRIDPEQRYEFLKYIKGKADSILSNQSGLQEMRYHALRI